MKIEVLNRSPKGDNSVTMSYIKYLTVKYPEHQFEVQHIAQKLQKLEKNEAAFQEAIGAIRSSDGVVWAFPLYFMLVHSNLKRFIELIFEKGETEAFTGKYTASFSTSIHFYDHTAHNYMRGICEDLSMHFMGSYSAGMQDLMEEDQRENLCRFFDGFVDAIKEKAKPAKTMISYQGPSLDYQPGPAAARQPLGGRKLVVLADAVDTDTNLGRMLQRFRDSIDGDIKIIDLSKTKIAGPCMGCLHCGFDNVCKYDGKDDVRAIYEKELFQADIIVFAAEIRDRYFSARWKNFLDRRFFRTHQPGYPGKQVGYLVSGHLAYDANLRQILEAQVETDQAHLVDIVTDEADIVTDEAEASRLLDDRISAFAGQLIDNAEKGMAKPRTSLGVGGAKIFRDDIWGGLRFVFTADYDYMRKHKLLDFPQKQIPERLMHLMIPFLKLKPVKKQVQAKMKDMMHFSHDRVILEEQKKQGG